MKICILDLLKRNYQFTLQFFFFGKAVQLEDLSSPARDKTQTLGTKSMES